MNKNCLIIGLSLCAIAICAIWLEVANNKKEIAPIRIATNPWPGFELLHLADKKGFFKEEGVNVKLIRFSALEDARRAYERGQVDGITGALIEIIKAHENGRSAKVLLITDFSNGSDFILARKGINSLADLKGKKIAVETESFGISMIAGALEKGGLSFDDVKLEGMNQLNISTALLSGKIDAAHTYSPYSTEVMKHKDKIVKLMDSSDIPNEIIDILAIDSSIISNRTEDMKAIKRAWNKTVTYAREHPKEANLIMAEIENISQQDFTDAMAGAKILNILEQKQLFIRDGILEQVLVKVNNLLHRDNPVKEIIQPDDYIAHIEDDKK